MAKPPLDVEGTIRRVTVPPEGWQKVLVAYGPPHPGQRGVEGLADPDGRPWEIIHSWKAGVVVKGLKEVARRIVEQEMAGYAFKVVDVEGTTYVVERFLAGTQLRLWDGLSLAGPWKDQSCGGCPWQMHAPADWTHPGGQVVERVTLYVRHRSWSIDPDGCTWEGYVQRYDEDRDGWYAAIRCPSSPDLLPKLAPRDAPPPEPPPEGGFLSALRIGAPKPKPRPDVGFAEEDAEGAQRALLARAEAWLHEHGHDDAAWVRVPERPPAYVEDEEEADDG
jgi:hypothetical protein